mgnify:CR=1 FL=1|jgi:hypothetical protein
MHLNALLREADLARKLTRQAILYRSTLSEQQIRALHRADSILAGPLPPRVECGLFLSRSVHRRQLAYTWIRCFKTSIAPIFLPRRQARALAVTIDEVVRFVDGAVNGGEHAAFCLVVANVDRRLIVGLRVEGSVEPVADLSGMTSLLRAAAIVSCLHGEFQRGMDGKRMVFGISLDGNSWLETDGR